MFARQRDDRLDLDAGRVHLEQDKSDTLLRLDIRIGAHEAEHAIGEMRVRRPDLRSVQYIIVAVADRAQLQRGKVGPRSRLRIALAERKSVVMGTSEAVSVDHGGRRIITKKTNSK